jgi:hypothetical protein
MRMRGFRLVVPAVIAALATALVVAATGGARTEQGHKRTAHHPNLLRANLTGAREVPGPGDPDGRGNAVVKLLPRFDAVCFHLGWRNIGTPTAAHIHQGRKGVAGPVVVLFFSGQPDHKGCVNDVDRDLIRAIRRHPRDYYVNIHTTEFPNGAIRGQLKRAGHRHHGQRHKRGRHS